MSSKEYRKIILVKLLNKYYQRIAKNTVDSGRRIIIKPTELYKDYHQNNADIRQKQSLNEAAEQLRQKDMIGIDYLKFSTDMERLYLSMAEIENIIDYLETEYAVTPRKTIFKYVNELLAKYDSAGTLVKYYQSKVREQISNPKIKVDLVRLKADFQMLDFLDHNKESLYVREASMLVYGDSKQFEKDNYDEVCSIIREAVDCAQEETERNDVILARYSIVPTEQEIFIKGDWKIEWQGYTLETAKLQGGMALTSTDLQSISHITVNSQQLMTIENRTSYQRMDATETAMLYLGGFANHQQIMFLLKVIQDNPDIGYYHFGDIDIGGFLIHRHLCRATRKGFQLYCMGTEQLRDKRYMHGLKQMTDNDQKRLEALLDDEDYREIALYMKKHHVKLEQEIVSYYLSKSHGVID